MKEWYEMTETEISALKRRQCYKCAYYSRTGGEYASAGTCNYIVVEGHRRGCSPLECLEEGKFKPKNGRRINRLTLGGKK